MPASDRVQHPNAATLIDETGSSCLGMIHLPCRGTRRGAPYIVSFPARRRGISSENHCDIRRDPVSSCNVYVQFFGMTRLAERRSNPTAGTS